MHERVLLSCRVVSYRVVSFFGGGWMCVCVCVCGCGPRSKDRGGFGRLGLVTCHTTLLTPTNPKQKQVRAPLPTMRDTLMGPSAALHHHPHAAHHIAAAHAAAAAQQATTGGCVEDAHKYMYNKKLYLFISYILCIYIHPARRGRAARGIGH